MSIQEFRYTICPVGNSSFLSANREEFLQAAFEKRGVKPTLLQSLPRDQWHVHFDYQDPALFREGGNIPPIWAKSNDADVVLIGLAFLPHRTFLLVRNDSNVDSVEQLRGLRLGVPVNADAIIDFYRATVEHGFETALGTRRSRRRGGIHPSFGERFLFVRQPGSQRQFGPGRGRCAEGR